MGREVGTRSGKEAYIKNKNTVTYFQPSVENIITTVANFGFTFGDFI